MDYKILLYIIGFIIYSIYSARKAQKKKEELRNRANPKPQQKSWEEELKEILTRNADLDTSNNRYYQDEDEDEVEVEVKMNNPSFQTTSSTMPEVKEYEQHRQEDWKAHLAQEKYSVEVDETSLADHIRELEENMESREDKHSVGHQLFHQEGFDARKAFIYSEIFRAKYQED